MTKTAAKRLMIACGSRPWELWVRRWGFSCLIGEDLLMDCFSTSKVLFSQAKKLGVDLQKVRTVVISHDHWDHTGGLWDLLKLCPNLEVYLPHQASEETRERIRQNGGVLREVETKTEIRPGLYLMPEMTFVFRGENLGEQCLVQKTDEGLAVLVGCAHPGIVDMIRKIKEIFQAPVFSIAGGLHLMDQPKAVIDETAKALKAEGVTQVSPTHCTGWRAEFLFRCHFRQSYKRWKEGGML